MRYLGSSADQKDAIAREYIDEKLAPVETSPATAAHTAGSLLLYNGTLYRATADIAIGATLTVGTNIAATDLDEVASLLKSAIIDTASIDNAGLISYKHGSTVKFTLQLPLYSGGVS